MTVSDQSELSGTPKYRLHWCMECAHLDQSLQTALGIQEMHNYNLEHLCVGECGWTGSRRKVTQDGSTILFSVKDNAYSSGVATSANRQAAKSLMMPRGIICDIPNRAGFTSSYYSFTILQCHAPTNKAEE